MTVHEILSDVLAREGGYVDHPSDRGGCTNMGITRVTLHNWRGIPVTCDDVKNLTEQEARAIYKQLYIEKPGFGVLPDGPVKALLIDFAVNSGPRAAIRAVQKLLGLTVDGICGPVTQQAIVGAGDGLYGPLLKARAEYIAGILQRDPTQRAFAAGWLRRLFSFVR